MRAQEDFMPLPELEDKLRALDMALNINDVAVIRRMLTQLVSGYTPSGEIVDWVHMEQGSDELTDRSRL